jgi:hypothetical protein
MVCAACLFSAPSAFSNEAQTPAPTSSKPFTVPSGTVPAQIFGNDCAMRSGDSVLPPILVCQPEKITEKPSISVSSVDNKCELTQVQMMEKWRRFWNDGTPFFNIVWERDFAPVSVPGAIGFKGFYQKSLGNRYVWTVCGQGKLTTVMATLFAPTDNDALKADIELKVFGVAQSQPTVSKDKAI